MGMPIKYLPVPDILIILGGLLKLIYECRSLPFILWGLHVKEHLGSSEGLQIPESTWQGLPSQGPHRKTLLGSAPWQ